MALELGIQLASSQTNNYLTEAVITFAITLIVYVGLMGTVCYLLGKFWKNILAGIGVMLSLLIVTALSTFIIDMISTVASKEDFLKNIIKGVGAIAGVISSSSDSTISLLLSEFPCGDAINLASGIPFSTK